jgi:hypothetical protein
MAKPMLNVIAFPNLATPDRRAIYLRFAKVAPIIAWPAPAHSSRTARSPQRRFGKGK